MAYKGYAELAGATLASLVSFLFANYAQPVIAAEQKAVFETSATMRTALAVTLFLVALLTLMLATLMFKEIPIERRRQYHNLKR